MANLNNLIASLSIDSLVFDNQNFILEDVKGLEGPTLRLPRYNLPGQSGANVSNALYGERAISIKGVVNAPDSTPASQKPVVYLNNRNALINALAYKRDIYDNLIPQTLTVVLTNGFSVTAQVYQDKGLQMGFSPDAVDYEEFQVTLIAPDPALYSTTQTQVTISLPSGGGTAIPTAMPLSLAPGVGGQAIINNAGANSVSPVITLVGPLTNPYVINLATSQFVALNYTINVGDPNVIIDMATQQITQGITNISYVMTVNSEFWSLASGANSVGFNALSGSGTATVSFYPSFNGI